MKGGVLSSGGGRKWVASMLSGDVGKEWTLEVETHDESTKQMKSKTLRRYCPKVVAVEYIHRHATEIIIILRSNGK
jgi:hypothetical protein